MDQQSAGFERVVALTSFARKVWNAHGAALGVLLAAVFLTPTSWAQEGGAETEPDASAPPPAEEAVATEEAAIDDGPSYQISAFDMAYLRPNPLHPPLEDLSLTEVTLGRLDGAYVMPRPGVELATFRLADVESFGVETYRASAVQRLLETLRDELVARDLMGVYVAPDPRQINEIGQDLRPEAQTSLTLVITTGIVTELRTLGSGDRWRDRPEERVDNPVHERHRTRSPIQPYVEGEEPQRDLLRKDALDRYLFHLSRHTGRRVDASVAASEEIGGVTLDYMVTENRPLVLYFQVANTGTQSTGYWRERFGLMHTQLTENDDVLTFDYITAEFDDTNALAGTYEAPFGENDRIRWRVFASWSEYDASEVGFFGDTFSGETWMVGGEVIANIYQKRELFIDLFGGARFQNIRVHNPLIGDGEEDFLIPRVGLRLDRTTEWFSTQAMLALEWHTETLDDVDDGELVRLGRTLPDDEWAVLRWDLRHSVFLEPLLNREAWEDPGTPESSTLAHELLLRCKGQYAFDSRLIPQEEGIAGGLYTVRGYPESVTAGDSAVIGTLEYRYHLPRAFEIEPEPRELFGEPFRTAPQYVYGHPDWDLILKGFLDIGQTYISDKIPSFEDDRTLVGAGVGVEFIYKRNLNVRLDWGFALEDLDVAGVDEGSNRLHFVATILF